MVKGWIVNILNPEKAGRIRKLKDFRKNKGIVVEDEKKRLVFKITNPEMQKTISALDVEFFMSVLLKGKTCVKGIDYSIEVFV